MNRIYNRVVLVPVTANRSVTDVISFFRCVEQTALPNYRLLPSHRRLHTQTHWSAPTIKSTSFCQWPIFTFLSLPHHSLASPRVKEALGRPLTSPALPFPPPLPPPPPLPLPAHPWRRQWPHSRSTSAIKRKHSLKKIPLHFKRFATLACIVSAFEYKHVKCVHCVVASKVW